MRKLATVAALTVLGAASAAGVYTITQAPREAMTADLERDLQLASTVQAPKSGVVSAIEQGRNGAPSGEARGQRMVVPTKKRAPLAAPSPTVMETPAATTPTEVAPEPTPLPAEVVTVAASTGEAAVETAAAPADNSYPTPAGGPSATAGNDGEMNRGTGTMRRGGVGTIGAIAGAIIRGASVGRPDHCEPRGSTPRPAGDNTRGGPLGEIGGIIANGGNRPIGTIPGGAMPGGRRW